MKTILTVIGKDTVGIIAGISQKLSQLNINILDVNQTIMDGFFTMIMVLDCSQANQSFDVIMQELDNTAEQLKVKINHQRQEIFEAMHRL